MKLQRKKSGSLIPRLSSPWQAEFQHISSVQRRFVERCITVALVLCGLYSVHLHFRYREDLQAKYTPTVFSDALQRKIAQSPWKNPRDESDGRRILDQREDWKRIGGGWEGDIFMYNDTVIKTFVASRSPLRNCMKFTEAPTKIPTEIPATAWLGGLKSGINKATDFMPIRDYFLTPATETEPASWHLLTPYLVSGNLEDLAKRLQPFGFTFRQLDASFRPSLHRMLGALEKMHDKYHLCHDDIKPGNIFVTGIPPRLDVQPKSDGKQDTHWLLSDFGNVREVTHPYHSSMIWTRDSHQHRDCRMNDAVRLIKTYVMFLRSASAENGTASFDAAFWGDIEPWSELYWTAVREPLLDSAVARSLRDKSLSLPPLAFDTPVTRKNKPHAPGCLLGLSCKLQNTEKELDRGMWVTEDKARVFAATSIFGVPQGQC
ncbi:hypothetical protein F5Y19DRAFT_232701 [Xylariaceae sp. FL1651]|nr:hypothetical protein F5Y19DRAFT_232701 [Xylariaceae sp. FL1651]